MKRKLFWISVVVVFVAVAVFINSLRNRNERVPYFVAGAPASIPKIKFVDYQFLADAPFEGDRLWLWTWNSNGPRTYLYDLKKRAIVGELFDGAITGICSRDGSSLLVRGVGAGPSFQQEISDIIAKLFHKTVRVRSRTEIYWVLDISRNVATKLGQFSQAPGAGSLWRSSPDFRRAYTVVSTTAGVALFVCDLDEVGMTRYDVNGYPEGWWDDRHILLESRQEQFQTFDIQTEATTTLFTHADIHTLLTSTGITNVSDLSAAPHWNGTNYDFYLGLMYLVSGLHGNSFLVRANRSGPPLTIVSTNFGFHWGASFNDTSGLYLFQGEKGPPGRSGDGAVYVRNLTNGTETMLVPPDNKGQYALPRFYGNEVIYSRDRVLHRIELNGSNDSVILPEPAK